MRPDCAVQRRRASQQQDASPLHPQAGPMGPPGSDLDATRGPSAAATARRRCSRPHCARSTGVSLLRWATSSHQAQPFQRPAFTNHRPFRRLSRPAIRLLLRDRRDRKRQRRACPWCGDNGEATASGDESARSVRSGSRVGVGVGFRSSTGSLQRLSKRLFPARGETRDRRRLRCRDLPSCRQVHPEPALSSWLPVSDTDSATVSGVTAAPVLARSGQAASGGRAALGREMCACIERAFRAEQVSRRTTVETRDGSRAGLPSGNSGAL
jgi:hypothetical protein